MTQGSAVLLLCVYSIVLQQQPFACAAQNCYWTCVCVSTACTAAGLSLALSDQITPTQPKRSIKTSCQSIIQSKTPRTSENTKMQPMRAPRITARGTIHHCGCSLHQSTNTYRNISATKPTNFGESKLPP